MKSVRNKSIMCALAVMSFVGVADASQFIVFEAPLDNWDQQISADFVANRELSRAWIDVHVGSTNSGGEERLDGQVISKAIEGLYYDPAHKQVLYRTATETIVCAEDATLLWTTYLKSTGKCQLTSFSEERKIDDGFKIREQTVAKVIFEAHTSGTSQHALFPKR